MQPHLIRSTEHPLNGVNRILVTGGTGFVGSHLVASLRQIGKEVSVPSRQEGFDLLAGELSLRNVDHVFHLAAQTGVVESWKDPAAFHLVNSQGTVRLLEQCRKHHCSMTYVSGYVYGRNRTLPINETDNVEPSNPYAFSKFAAEEACRFYARVFNLPIVILRPFNIYGPGQSDRFLLPHIIRQALDPKSSKIEVLDLAPRRDYVFVRDVVEAAIASVEAKPGGTFNVGSGNSYSVEEAIKITLRLAGIEKPYGCPDRQVRTNEIDDVVADIKAIRESLGWQPATSFEEGLRITIANTQPGSKS